MLPEVTWGCQVKEGQTVMVVDGFEPSMAELKSDEVNAKVSFVAAIPEVRELLVAKQREFLNQSDLVMEGRDIGTVVFPETLLSKFLSPPVRKVRRSVGKQKGLMMRWRSGISMIPSARLLL